ncbi:MAG: NADPH-dependent FMN reductase, partial [Polyangiales bacterium]
MSDRPVSILGVAGSLRAASWNKKLLAAAAKLLPESATLATFDLAEIPLYNEDVREKGYPDGVARFRAAIADADAVLLVTPEYNYSVPGVLKNALDWASRPPSPPF